MTVLAATDKALRIGGSFIRIFEVPGEGRDTLRQVATTQLEGFLVARPVPRPANVLDLPPVTIIRERGHRGYHRRA